MKRNVSRPAVGLEIIRRPYPIHYVIVRDDLPIGLSAAMIGHAAGESMSGFSYVNHVRRLDNEELTTICVLQCSYRELQALHRKLCNAPGVRNVHYVPFFEPDAPWNGKLMSIGFHPVWSGGTVSQLLKRYKLYGTAKGV